MNNATNYIVILWCINRPNTHTFLHTHNSAMALRSVSPQCQLFYFIFLFLQMTWKELHLLTLRTPPLKIPLSHMKPRQRCHSLNVARPPQTMSHRRTLELRGNSRKRMNQTKLFECSLNMFMINTVHKSFWFLTCFVLTSLYSMFI